MVATHHNSQYQSQGGIVVYTLIVERRSSMHKILIAGDRTIDWFSYSQPAADIGENWRLVQSTQEFCAGGGVLLLDQLTRAAIKMRNLSAEVSVTPPPVVDLHLVSPREVIQSNARLELFAIEKGKEKEKKKCWRVGQSFGFQGPPRGDLTAIDAPEPPMSEPELIVLDDHGNAFRNTEYAWPVALKEWTGGVPLIHKMRHPLNKGRQPDSLWELLEKKLKTATASQYVLVVSADDLRETEGVRISQGLSWERTAKELLHELKYAPALQPLQHCPCIVVLFGWEGVIVCRPAREDSQESVATLHFDSERIERGFSAEIPGTMFGMTSVFIATLIGRIVKAEEEFKADEKAREEMKAKAEEKAKANEKIQEIKPPQRPTFFEMVDAAVPECLARARWWMETGFGNDGSPSENYPVEIVFPVPKPDQKPLRIGVDKSCSESNKHTEVETVFGELNKNFPYDAKLECLKSAAGVPTTFRLTCRQPVPTKGPREDMFSWTMVPPVSSQTDPDPAVWRIVNQEWAAISVVFAMEYVRTGKSPGLLRSPIGVFGDLRTVDRREIESFNAIRTLVQEFLDGKPRKRPLCLGVFGPPGAGKSFGVEEVVTSIGGERVEKLPAFNVSQFSSEDDLIAACHRIRDSVLKGKTPFVFFDEFDSAGLDGTEFGWLRSFLSLMQDGKFRDGEEMHPLGKCILVFAGGTSDTFLEFESRAMRLPSARKGRDFVSRFHGYINILGPNPQGDDPSFVLRRAIVLRSMFERNKDAAGLFNAKKELRIDTGVLRALLLVSKYKHGTRSMESLLDMSQLEGQTRFDQYALPARDQLLIHVPADEFLSKMSPGLSDSAEIEQFRSWLTAIGYEVREIPKGRSSEWGRPGDRPQTPLIGDDDILKLAVSAHQWWSDKETEKSITQASEEVPENSTPYLCAFDVLPEAIRKLVFSRVEQIPVILHDAGLEIFDPAETPDWTDSEMGAKIDKLAKLMHGSYQDIVDAEVGDRRSKGFLPIFNSNATPFEKLPPAKQESNRDSIRTIPRKLARIGLKLKKRTPTSTEPADVTIQKMADRIRVQREELAVIEHTRWNWQSLMQGYVYKPGEKSDERRTNPSIVPWDKLPESVRKYDRVEPEEFAGLIFEAGYEIV